MKKCPHCGREYDNSMSFCLDDGKELLYGPATSVSPPSTDGQFDDEPQTSIFHETGGPYDVATKAPVRTTEQTAVLTTNVAPPPTDQTAARPSTPPVPSRSFDKRLLLAAIALAVIVLGGFAFYRYFASDASGQINSIAVLPFENRSGNPDSDYLSDGLAESLIYRLTQLPNLKVSPTSSVFRYKGNQADVAQVARELEVDAVMSGRVAQRGDDLTISVELIDARTKKLIWAEQYDRKMADLLATQREIATTITQKLELKLSGSETKGITKKYTESNEAYQLYLRGRYSFAKRTKEEMLKAVDYFQQAIKLDRNFALAYARIAETYGSMPAYPYLSPKEAFPPAKAAAQRALEIDPTLSEAHTFLAYCLAIYDWDWPGAEQSFKRAIELDPNNSAAHFRYGQIYLLGTGRGEEAIAEMKRGLEIEPLDINMRISLAAAYHYFGRIDEAHELAKSTYELEPTHVLARWIIAQTYTEKGMYADAITIDEQWLQGDPTNQFALRDLGVAYARSGQREKAQQVIDRYRELAKGQYVATCRIAIIYGALGELDKAFAELDAAIERRDWELHRMKVDKYWAPLQSDPRFKERLKRLNLPE